MPEAVVTMTAPSTHVVVREDHVRKPYSTVRLIQMKWNGIVSQSWNQKIAIRLSSEKMAQPTSMTRLALAQERARATARPEASPGPGGWRDL
jgi:hypothetical protein